jgi:hypothetical protein
VTQGTAVAVGEGRELVRHRAPRLVVTIVALAGLVLAGFGAIRATHLGVVTINPASGRSVDENRTYQYFTDIHQRLRTAIPAGSKVYVAVQPLPLLYQRVVEFVLIEGSTVVASPSEADFTVSQDTAGQLVISPVSR